MSESAAESGSLEQAGVEIQGTLSRGSDHLGLIEANLRSLTGFGTLANELIQNADDAPGATWITFDLTDDALIIENNGVFSDCGQQSLTRCPWFVDPDTDFPCDFHSFRSVGSGPKRNREGTTGAFGIGFTAVYQVTDRPELVSVGQHWIIREELPESQRIAVVGGPAPSVAGTRFRLPWATDPDSFLRKRLRVSPISDLEIDEIELEMAAALGTGILFLKQLDALEVRRRGVTIRRVERLATDDRILVNDGEEREWLVIRGDFEVAAAAIRSAFPDKIEKKRTGRVTLALPLGFEIDGILAQGLPTQQLTGLPFHVNADFFPTSDRKKVVLESDFQGEWNRAALAGAADALATSLVSIRDALGHVQIWKMIDAVRKAATSGYQDPVGKLFWEALLPALSAAPVALGVDGQWHRLAEVLRAQQDEVVDADQELLALGITLLHRELRPYTFSLPGATGLRTVSAADLVTAFHHQGLVGRVAPESIPAPLRKAGAMERLWKAVDQILERPSEARSGLTECALVPVIAGGLASAAQAFAADPDTVALFGRCVDLPFVDQAALRPSSPRLLELCPQFDADEALKALESLSAADLKEAYQHGRFEPDKVLQWFAAHIGSDARASLRGRLARLPVYPAGAGLASLADLMMVGDFDDPLGLTQFVDLTRLHGLKGFLSDLGIQTLDLRTYVRRLPAVVEALGGDFDSALRAQVVRLLADRLGELRDDDQVRQAAKHIALADVGDAFVSADEAYFAAPAVTNTLGEGARLVRLAPGHESADRDLLEWLGVRATPRASDLQRRVADLTRQAPSQNRIEAIGLILEYVGVQSMESGLWQSLSDLKEVPWLPAEGERRKWLRPGEIYTAFSKSLFYSQASFLDVALQRQQKISDYLKWLGVRSQPSTQQVVSHLLWLTNQGATVPINIYQTLNDDAADPCVAQLRGIACLKFGDQAYRADQVFWGEHGLAPYLHRLPQASRQYATLLDRLGVKDTPDHDDAMQVLAVLAHDVGHRPLTPEQVDLVLNCWSVIERNRDEGKVDDDRLHELHAQPCVPATNLVLEPPDWMYFEDRPGLSAKFGPVLKSSIIERVPGAWRAMRVAGVRDLGRVVQLHVLEKTEPRPGAEVESRIRARRDLLERVIQVHAPAAGDANRDLLASLQAVEVSELVLQYSVALGGTTKAESEPKSESAVLVSSEANLYYVSDEGIPPWSAIARELAIGLFPTLEPGGPASGFRDVLNSNSRESAEIVLDDLLYPRLSTNGLVRTTEELLDSLGSEETPNDEALAEDIGADLDAYESETEPEVSAPGQEDAREGAKPSTGATGSGSGTEADGDGSDQRGLDGQGGGTSPGGSSKKQRQSRLRSYVIPDGATGSDGNSRQTDETQVERRTAIEEAGVQRVVEAELRAGWVPEVMPPGNPGFDIRSMSPIGDMRLIEVKATAVEWGEQGVGVSHRQFLTSLEEEGRFWLYVVERADDDENFRVFRIFNPAGRVEQFMFDGGWRGLDAGPELAATVDEEGHA